ncbi:MAG: hypothetical protein HUU35_20050, partial [Armatimonadetes bacterium]|nr:hypothetical protein [Armatimonadota bacterium]
AEHQFALVVGLLTPWLLLAPLQAADAYHAETADGVVLLGLAGLWLLLQLAERRW